MSSSKIFPTFAVVLVASGILALAAAPAKAQGATVAVTLRTDPSRPLGTDPGGRLLLYAPNPLELGSSISHWDPTASPDLLMEPSSSPDLAFGQLDLTLPAMRDLGWRQGSANITLRIQDSAGTGFNDPALGAQRLAAMQFVAQRWAGVLRSNVEINLGVSFTSLPCSQNSGVLAQAGANFIFESFPGAPLANTWYHGALAESLSGQNLSLEDTPGAPNSADIVAQFNSQIDEDCLAPGTGFYYGLDGNVPSGRVGFVNVALHEIGHGLGFSAISTDPQTGLTLPQLMGLSDIFERQLLDTDLGRTWNQMSAGERQASAVNTGKLVWAGALANGAAPGILDPGLVVAVETPSALAGLLHATPAQFGPQLGPMGLSGELALGTDGTANPSLGCSALVNAGQVAGKIAVLDRGICNFTVKVKNAQNAGALAVVVINNIPGPPIAMGGQDPTIHIPSVQISQDDGGRLRQALTIGVPPIAPSGLTVVPLPGSRSRLSWTDNSDDETGFRIERRRDGAGGFQLRTTTGANVSSFEDSGLTSGATYTYRVRAQNAAGPSAFSNTASITVDDTPAVPDAPTKVRASTLSSTSVVLEWELPSSGEESFVVQARKVSVRGPGGGALFDEGSFETVAEVAAAENQATIGGLDPETTYNLRVQAVSSGGGSPFAGPVAATTEADAPPVPCTAGGSALCLLDGRFEVRAFFKDQFNGGATGDATAVPFSTDSGLYWFFNGDNIELIAKMIDATTVTDSYWFFYGALSNVEYWITVTDTDTGSVRTYYNPPNKLGAEADTQAFLEPVPAQTRTAPEAARVLALPLPAESSGLRPAAGAGTGAGACQPGPTTLCLVDDRFEVTVEWSDPRNGGSGDGRALPLTGNDTTGTFWFFRPENLELLVKVIDGRVITGHFWVFFGGLTDLPYTLRVRDTQTGNQKVYINPFGDLVGETDTQALDPE